MLSKIQTDTRLSGRLLDQGLNRASPRLVSSNLCALHSTFSVYHARSLLARAKRLIFKRLQRLPETRRRLANFLRISNFSDRVNLPPRLSLAQSPNPFISLRGSKEPSSDPAGAKPQLKPFIRTAQNPKETSKRPIRSRSTQLLLPPTKSAKRNAFRFPQLQQLGFRFGPPQTPGPDNRDPTLGLRSDLPAPTSTSIRRANQKGAKQWYIMQKLIPIRLEPTT